MADLDVLLGIVGWVADGEYDPGKEYSKGKLVSFDGGSYLYKYPTPSTGTPLTTKTHWQQIATMGGQDLVDAAVAARDAAQGYKDTAVSAKDTAVASAAQLAAWAAGPAGTYVNLAALISANPDHSKIYITLNDGKWCYHNGTAFVAGGVYQAVQDVDSIVPTTLSRKGEKLFPVISEWKEVFAATGEGILETMFFAGDYASHRTKIDIIVDGSYAVQAYLFELIGCRANVANSLTYGNDLFGKTGATGGIYLNFKIPYYASISVNLKNDTDATNPYVWFNCRTSSWHDFYVGGVKIPYGAHFHCIRGTDSSVASGEEVTLYDSNDSGVILGMTLFSVGATSMWYMEGMLRIYKGGSPTAELLSSGMEDYFMGTYYFATGPYQYSTAGCTYISAEDYEFAGYRLHTIDTLAHDDSGFIITLRNNDLNTEDAVALLNETACAYAWNVMSYNW